MQEVSITVEELTGDTDTDEVYLTTPVDAIPGGGAPGSQVNGTVIPIFPGLSFLAISADQGDTPYGIEELEGAGPDADGNRYIVATKEEIPYEDGTTLSGFVFQAASGPVLLIQLPGAVPPATTTASA